METVQYRISTVLSGDTQKISWMAWLETSSDKLIRYGAETEEQAVKLVINHVQMSREFVAGDYIKKGSEILYIK
ncbi:MAG: hypothetical protein EOP04_09005 [Proteobacteria bacterium]|nr:MAG: hypothetical protein EOP04_09005 [Pseudomonadota bacterium]